MTDLVELVETLRNAQTEILRLAPFRDIGLVPNPGASTGAISAAEERLGVALPPSYKAFLRHFDGWPRCFEGASLLGTACLGNRVYTEFAHAAFAAAETPEPELGPPTRPRRYAHVIPFGVDLQSTTLFAFNPSVVSSHGEYEVIAWINELGMRRESFPSFLELLIELAEYELEGHRSLHREQDQTSQAFPQHALQQSA
jgi:hypothetical protein